MIPHTSNTQSLEMEQSTPAITLFKTIHFLRHGQAQHNINAERMKKEGCSHDAFLKAMQTDDQFDAALTALGVEQARVASTTAAPQRVAPTLNLVVASPLSRAIDTADLVFPAHTATCSRVCLEPIREINGWLVNAKRMRRSELAAKYPAWEFSQLSTEEDVQWAAHGDILESHESTQARAYETLQWLWARPEQNIALVGHGGIFGLLTNDHAHIKSEPGVGARFENCELRSCKLYLTEDGPEPRFGLSMLEA
jgi:broad specificity phosphatase PhoE